MNEVTAEWVEKAESDYRVALREAKVTDEKRSPDAICFHAQQCVEKYAKAFLQDRSIAFRKTHNMLYLHAECSSADPEFDEFREDFERLDEYSVEIRYPGDDAAESDAFEAVLTASRLREFIRGKLGLTET